MRRLRNLLSKSTRRWLRQRLGPIVKRIYAINGSLWFDPQEFGSQQFIRFPYYVELKRLIATGSVPDAPGVKVIEFGASNNVIPKMFRAADYVIAPNWPAVDIQNLVQYAAESFDVVIIDQIMEHVPHPHQAAAEIARVLKPGGICLCATPFLIQIHGHYGDYWRYTELGLKQLFSQYSSVEVFSWGNRFTLETTIRRGWINCQQTKRQLRVALWNEPEWPLVFLTKAVK
jgi:SAM-dependent methyltransferase